jgi:hypothetical protein
LIFANKKTPEIELFVRKFFSRLIRKISIPEIKKAFLIARSKIIRMRFIEDLGLMKKSKKPEKKF